MPSKIIDVPTLGSVTVRKHRAARRMTLRVNHDGTVVVTIPPWVPYASAAAFALSRQGWIEEHQVSANMLTQDMPIGKAHHLVFESTSSTRISTRLRQNQAVVILPSSIDASSAQAQTAAQRIAIRALTEQAEKVLPTRLRELAGRYSFSFSEVRVRQLKSRWGSCSDKGLITLNCFLMQLPWPLIDYVLVHELSHTKVHSHSPKFWAEVLRCTPTAKDLRKQLRTHKPTLTTTDS